MSDKPGKFLKPAVNRVLMANKDEMIKAIRNSLENREVKPLNLLTNPQQYSTPVMGVDWGKNSTADEKKENKTSTTYTPEVKWIWSDGSYPDSGDNDVESFTFPKRDDLPAPDYDIDQIIKMSQLSQVPSLQKAVDELSVVIKRLIEKYQLGPVAALAFIKMVEQNIFVALIDEINEVYE